MTIDRQRTRRHLPNTVLLLITGTVSLVASGPGVLPGDVAITHMIQRAPTGSVGRLLHLMNIIGETPIMLAIGAILAVICWRRQRLDAMALIVAASFARTANPILKAIFESPRPTSARVPVAEFSSGWGFPSGHVMGMTLFVGALVCLAWDAWPQRHQRIVTMVLATSVLIASGAGRIYVAAHWPSDVLGGYLYGTIGTIVLAWCWRHWSSLVTRAKGRPVEARANAVSDTN